jgi:NADH:ubiquinone oxidoreductase subunit 6 (subunit J)
MIAGALLVTQRNPARAALAFALVVLSTCGLFLLLAAPFLMAATVIVYAGAIVVTFLFVIMLAQQEGLSAADQRSREPLLATIAGFLLLGTLLYVLAVGAGQDRERSEHLRRVQEYQQAILALSRESAGDDETAARRSLELLDDLGSSLARLRSPSPEQPSAAQLGGEDLDRTVRLAEEEVAVQQFRLLDGKTVDWGRVSDTLARVGNRLAGLQPRQGLSLSDLSGPAPNQDLRRDANGRPEMPAENVAYLGRSLFTDYLIAVELGGTLLLVATIGAIAIAQRRREGP